MKQMNVKMVGTTDDPIDSWSITPLSPKTPL
jgi:glucuronate isomerase